MEKRFLEKLPGELRAVVQKVEELTGHEIGVMPNTNLTQPASLEFGVRDGECIAIIEYKGDDIGLCALAHEVLHLKRYCLDVVPVLRGARDDHVHDAQVWEDLLEHLVIIVEEQRFAKAESNAHWRAVLDAYLSDLIRLRSEITRKQFQRGLIQLRAMLDIALPDLDHDAVYGRLRENNIFDRSTRFVASLRGAMNDKMRGIVLVIQELGFDPDGFRVGQYDLTSNPKKFVHISRRGSG